MKRLTHPGFTFFEILLVLFITIAITGLGMVSLFRIQTIFQLRNSADETISLLQYGRELAIAGVDQAEYAIALSGGIVSLRKNNLEIQRYQLPTKVLPTPSSLNWVFLPLTGKMMGCQPCQITLSTGDINEVISISDYAPIE